MRVLRVLRDDGLSASSLQDVFRATVIAKLTYTVPQPGTQPLLGE